MDWGRVNVWTNTLYTLIHSLHISKQISFGNLTYVDRSILDAGTWITPDCSYKSALVEHPFGNHKTTFRRDPNKHFSDIANQIVQMLLQDLVVILDEMLSEALRQKGESAGPYPQSKVEKLATHLDEKYTWAKHGCFELVAVRNVLTHNGGRWNDQSIAIISEFVKPPPASGDKLSIGFAMLFRYRKAMRTFLNETTREKKPRPGRTKRVITHDKGRYHDGICRL